MKRAFVLLALVALAFPASLAQSLSAESVTSVFQAWADAMSEQLDREKQTSGRHLLQDDSTSATSGLLGTLETAATSVQSFLENSLGNTWTDLVPSAWTNQTFDWSNLESALSNVTSLPSVFDEYESLTGKLCAKEQYSKGVKTDPVCSGPTVTLQYVPKVCVFSSDFKDMVCAPSNITLVRNPGSCVLDLQPASHYIGKECKVEFALGKSKNYVKGGSEYPINLKPIKKVLASVKDAVEEKYADKLDKIKDSTGAAKAAVVAGLAALKG